MPFFDSDGVQIHYEIEGQGPEVILIHGFAGSAQGNYVLPGIVRYLRNKNSVIMMDCRGHGLSAKPHENNAYGEKMVLDILNLVRYLGLEQANFMGYSMGASLCLRLTINYPEVVRSVILGGWGLNPPQKPGTQGSVPADLIVTALLATDKSTITDTGALGFRAFAESTGGDLQALAACMSGNFRGVNDLASYEKMVAQIKQIRKPLMTVCGNDDALVKNTASLAMLVPGATHVLIQGKDHLTVVADQRLKMAVGAFLDYVNGN